MSSSLPSTFVKGFHDEDAVRKMTYRPLGKTGMDVSIVSLGTSALGSVFRETKEEESIAVVVNAVKAGVNLLDSAAWYGHGKAEKVTGKALKQIPREAYFIMTKLGRYTPDVRCQFVYNRERTLASIDESLERLGLTYIDVMQIHDPEFAGDLDQIINETLPAMEEARKAGKIKFIGMTGYPLDVQMKIIDGARARGIKIDTSLTYCHYSLNDRSLLAGGFLEYTAEHGIGVVNASSLSMGMLTERGPPAWHPALPEQKAASAKAVQLAKDRGFNISKIAMQFSLALETIPSTLVSTSNPGRMAKNLEWATTTATPEEQAFTKEVLALFDAELGDNTTWTDHEPTKFWIKLGKQAQASSSFAPLLTMKDGIYAVEDSRPCACGPSCNCAAKGSAGGSCACGTGGATAGAGAGAGSSSGGCCSSSSPSAGCNCNPCSCDPCNCSSSSSSCCSSGKKASASSCCSVGSMVPLLATAAAAFAAGFLIASRKK